MNKKGFTLIEIVTTLAIVAMIAGLSLTALTSIPKTRMKKITSSFKTEFETTRNFAKTHGGDATFSIEPSETGLTLKRESISVQDNITELEDRDLRLQYKMTGDETIYLLGETDHPSVSQDGKLIIRFAQTNGNIIGKHMVDWVILDNGKKAYRLSIEQKSGSIYYDYQLKDGEIENEVLANGITIALPHFVDANGYDVDSISIPFNSSKSTTYQPELNYDARSIKISGIYRAKEKSPAAGYKIIFKLKDPYHTKWEDNSIEDKVLVWHLK